MLGDKYLESHKEEEKGLFYQFQMIDPTSPLGTLIAPTSWEGESAGCHQPQKFLPVLGASFLAQLADVSTQATLSWMWYLQTDRSGSGM